MKKRETVRGVAMILACTFAICSVACSQTGSASPDSQEESAALDEFRGYSWGTSEDDIKVAEISDDMVEYKDYTLEASSDMPDFDILAIMSASVGGYEASAGYLFYKGELCAGWYAIDLEDSDYDDMIEKYTEKYGDPFLEKESTGWGPVSIWADDEKNYICISDVMGGILYVDGDGASTDRFSENLEAFHEIDIDAELNKIGNTDGI